LAIGMIGANRFRNRYDHPAGQSCSARTAFDSFRRLKVVILVGAGVGRVSHG
jgi:hypothetical protein